MAKTPVRDAVIWARHIHGDDAMLDRLNALCGGETIELLVEGVRGTWRKMSDGRDGRATNGIRPVGAAQTFWKDLYAARRGEVVEIAMAPSDLIDKPLIYPALGRTQAERDAAFARLMSIADMGHSSEGRTLTRDEMHERD